MDSSREKTEEEMHAALEGLPEVDFRKELRAALLHGRSVLSVLREIREGWRSPGRTTPAEYFNYRLWHRDIGRKERIAHVGKTVQNGMHRACNDPMWNAASADKLLFQTIMTGAGLRVPRLLAVVSRSPRPVPDGVRLTDVASVAEFLRNGAVYPLFAKPIDGRYSLGVLSADSYGSEDDVVLMHGGHAAPVEHVAQALFSRTAGYVVQERMSPHPSLAARFGPALWSARVFVLLGEEPVIHRAVVKVAVSANPADNFWRPGNMVGAVDPDTGTIFRVVRGTGRAMEVDIPHPETGLMVSGSVVPDWGLLRQRVLEASRLFPAVGTQSWDVALSSDGPVPIEMNWGGDLNLAQLSHGRGVLDDAYRAHLTRNGYAFG